MENIFISNQDFDSYGSNSSDMSFYSVCSYNSQATLLSSSGPTWRPHHSEIVYRTLMSYVFSPASLPADSPVEINFEQKIKKVLTLFEVGGECSTPPYRKSALRSSKWPQNTPRFRDFSYFYMTYLKSKKFFLGFSQCFGVI